MAEIFKPLVDGDGNEEEENNVRDAAHHGGVDEADPAKKAAFGAAGECACEGEGEDERNGCGKQREDGEDRCERFMCLGVVR